MRTNCRLSKSFPWVSRTSRSQWRTKIRIAWKRAVKVARKRISQIRPRMWSSGPAICQTCTRKWTRTTTYTRKCQVSPLPIQKNWMLAKFSTKYAKLSNSRSSKMAKMTKPLRTLNTVFSPRMKNKRSPFLRTRDPVTALTAAKITWAAMSCRNRTQKVSDSTNLPSTKPYSNLNSLKWVFRRSSKRRIPRQWVILLSIGDSRRER